MDDKTTINLSKPGEYTVTASSVTPDVLTITPPGQGEVIRIAPDGKLFWHGREVETDADFRAAMMECAEYLSGKARIAPEVQATTALATKLTELDAARYRFLRWSINCREFRLPGACEERYADKLLDQAVDTAMADQARRLPQSNAQGGR